MSIPVFEKLRVLVPVRRTGVVLQRSGIPVLTGVKQGIKLQGVQIERSHIYKLGTILVLAAPATVS